MAYKLRRKSFRQKLKKPDEFISFSQRTILYMQENSKTVGIVATLAVIIVVSLGFFVKWSMAQRGEFFNRMFKETLTANSSFSDNQQEDAVKLFEKIREQNDKSSLFNEIAQVGLGYAYMESKDYDKSIKIFEELIARNDLNYPKEELYRNLSILYTTTGEHEKSAEIYMKMAELFPQSTDIATYMTKSSKTGQFQHP